MLKPETAMLNVIDVQGRLAEIVADAEDVQRNIVRLIEGTRLFNLPLLATEQVPEKLGATVPEVKAALGEMELPTKETFSCWQDEGIREAFTAAGRKQVLVCGIECHVCVYQTVRDLLENDYEVHLVVDAVSSRSRTNKEVAVRRMERAGALLTTTEMALFELKFDCTGEVFRKLSKLVK
jgi:nicotinamidase-related amidase